MPKSGAAAAGSGARPRRTGWIRARTSVAATTSRASSTGGRRIRGSIFRRMVDAAPSETFTVVLVTVPDAECGEKIARSLLEQRLAACVNRLGPIRSLFRWEGRIDAADEHLLVIKSRRELFDRPSAALPALHPHQVPEILLLPIAEGAPAYLRWLAAETSA